MGPRRWNKLIDPGAARGAEKNWIAHIDTCGADDAMSKQQYQYWRGGFKVIKTVCFHRPGEGRGHHGDCEKLSAVVIKCLGL